MDISKVISTTKMTAGNTQKYRRVGNVKTWSSINTGQIERKKNAPGSDGIVREMLTVLYDFGIDKISDTENKIYINIAEDLTKVILIVLSKNSGADERGFHRKISLIHHKTKLNFRILMNRTRSRNRTEIYKHVAVS